MNIILKTVDRSLSGHVTPLVYLLSLQFLIFGVSFVFFSDETTASRTILYPYGMYGGVSAWGVVLIVSSLLTIAGALAKNVLAVSFGGFGLFTSWLFATITYFESQGVFQASLAIINVLAAGYIFLAANLNRLWNYTPQK